MAGTKRGRKKKGEGERKNKKHDLYFSRREQNATDLFSQLNHFLHKTACTLGHEQVPKVLVSFVTLITVPQRGPKRVCHWIITSLVTNLLQQFRSKTNL